MYDVVAIGELLVDFTPSGISKDGNDLLEINPGGAPCNVLAMLSKLRMKTAFIGKIGDDHFGRMLADTIKNLGIENKGIVLDADYPTTLAFVHLDKGERSFSFYRNPGADIMLTKNELDTQIIENSKVLHFGTLSMTSEPVLSATKRAIEIAKINKLIISFDPNIRLNLWENATRAKEAMVYGFEQCDILKISDDELKFILNIDDMEKGAKLLANQYDIKLVLVTMGKKGSAFYFDGITGCKHTYDVKVIDTTGAGDTFYGCILYRILKLGLENLNKDYLNQSLDFANAAASIIVSRTGSLKSMPTLNEIINIQTYKNK